MVNPSDQRGSALILTLLIMMILIVLSGGLVTTVMTNARLFAAYNNRMQAYYYAKSGMEVAVDTIRQASVDLLVSQGDFYLWGSLSNMTLALGTYAGQYDDNLDIIVEVEWDGDTGKAKSLQLDTIRI
jgi:Tfp pilus assembly protein PilX